MSRQALVISVLLALALGLIALAVLFRPGPVGAVADAAGALLTIDPASVRTIRVERPGAAEAERIERVAGGGWRLVIERAGASPWPLIPARVRGLLAVLAELKPEGQLRAGMELPNDATTVTITQDDGSQTVLRLDPRSVGGRSLAAVDDRAAAFISDQVFLAFTEPGPRGWRDLSAMPGVGADVSRLGARTAELDLTLARIGARWYLRTPVSARADESSAQTLLGAMTGLTVVQFVDDASALPRSATGLDDPQLVLVAETDRRTIDESGAPRVVTEQRELRVGSAANIAGDTLYATPDGGQTVLIIGVGSLGAVSSDPAFYAARTATGAPAADVGMIVLSSVDAPDRGFRRGAEGWSRLATDGSQQPQDGAAVDELLSFLSVKQSQSVGFEAPAGHRVVGAVMLLDFEGEPIERIEVGVTDGGEIVLMSPALGAGADAPAFRRYDAAQAPALLALGAAAGAN